LGLALALAYSPVACAGVLFALVSAPKDRQRPLLHFLHTHTHACMHTYTRSKHSGEDVIKNMSSFVK